MPLFSFPHSSKHSLTDALSKSSSIATAVVRPHSAPTTDTHSSSLQPKGLTSKSSEHSDYPHFVPNASSQSVSSAEPQLPPQAASNSSPKSAPVEMPVPKPYAGNQELEPRLERPKSLNKDESDREGVVPWKGVVKVGVAVGKLVGDSLVPLPWVGPVVELVSGIVVMCQNVSKNKRAATKLGDHCQALLNTVQKQLEGPRREDVNRSREDLQHLLEEISKSLCEWSDLKWIEAFGRQESIAEKIKVYHVKIDNLCQSYQLTLITDISNWQQEHTLQARKDHEDLRSLLMDNRLQQEIEANCTRREIGALHDELTTFYGLVQNLLFEFASGSDRDRTPSNEQNALEANLAAIYRTTGELPPNLELTEGLIRMEKPAQYGSATYDIFRGTCFHSSDCVCAFKVVRSQSLGERTRELFDRQLAHWKDIQIIVTQARQRGEKVYVLQLVGAIFRETGPRPLLCFVSPWMEKGNAFNYVQQYPDINKLGLIHKIALGISVLHDHEPPLAHGNIRASNVLMDVMGDPHISDFGLMRIVEEEQGAAIGTFSLPSSLSSIRWFPPEYLGPAYLGDPNEHNSYQMSTKSDIFMFGMTVLELMTCKKPFSEVRRDYEITEKRMKGVLPVKPEDFNERLWSLLQRCWAKLPKDRPDIHEVIRALDDITS